MDLPFTLSQIGFGIVGFVLGIISKVAYWVIIESFEQRKEREDWYKEVSRLSGRVHSAFESQYHDFDLLPEDLDELREVESELNRLAINAQKLDKDIEENANQLRINLEWILSRDLIKHMPEDGVIINNDEAEGKLKQVNRVARKTREKSFDLHNESATKAKKVRYNPPIIRTKI